MSEKRWPSGSPMTPAEDDFRSHLYNWQLQIEEDITYLSDAARMWQPEDDRDTRLSIAHKRRGLIELLVEAIEKQDLWSALDHAVVLGIFSGVTQSFPYTYHAKLQAKLELRRLEPAIRLGQINMQATRAGGLATRKLPEREELSKELVELEREKPGQKKSWYQDEVGGRYTNAQGRPITGRAVRKALTPKSD